MKDYWGPVDFCSGVCRSGREALITIKRGSEENMNDLHDMLHEKLKQYFGFSTFKGNQEAVIRNVLAGKDTFVLMPTGGGKSLCYQLPALLMDGVAIVISPLIALMKNQVDAMRTFSQHEGIAHFLNSSLNRAAVNQVKEDVLAGRTKLLYFAPESLTKEDNISFLRKIKVSFYAIDEAHCISEWGHDFRPEYRRIRPIMNDIGRAPLIALTATATPKVQMDIQKNLGMTDAAVFKSSFNRPNLFYEIRPKNDAAREIIKYVKQNPGKSGIIYCLSRKKVEELAELLVANDIRALPYHAGMDARHAGPQPGCLPAGRGGCDCGYHRLRHGHRQAGRALRDSLRHTEKSGGILSGDRTCRPRHSRALRHYLL